MKARLYFAAVLFSCARVYESLTQIPFMRVLSLTQISQIPLNLHA